MPLAAIIDDQIFCVHGGIPRPPHADADTLSMVRALSRNIQIAPPSSHETALSSQLANDLLWSDPASEESEILTNCNGQQRVNDGACYSGENSITVPRLPTLYALPSAFRLPIQIYGPICFFMHFLRISQFKH